MKKIKSSRSASKARPTASPKESAVASLKQIEKGIERLRADAACWKRTYYVRTLSGLRNKLSKVIATLQD